MIKQKNITGFYSLIFCLLFLSSTAQDSAAKNTYAIVIGISGYQDAAIPKLQYADKDATLFATWLQSPAAGSVPQYNIKLLTNENATVAAFYNALDWVKQKAKKNDLVYIYFSGHGDVETKDNNSLGYLLAWNSPPNNYLNNAISVSDLNNTAEELTTKNKAKIILITDACHSGKMAGDYYKGRQLTAANLQLVLNNQVRIASCKENEEAAEGLSWGGGRGVFSFYLLKGLQGEAEKNKLVKLENLQPFLDACFAADTDLKLSKHQQHPVSNGNPQFTLAQIDPTTKVYSAKVQNIQNTTPSSAGLQSLRSVGPQPIDYFFELANQNDFENSLPFLSYVNDSSAVIPVKIVEDYYAYLKEPIDRVDEAYYKDSLKNDSTFKINMAGYLKQSLTPNTITTIQENDASRRQEAYKQNQRMHIPLNHLLPFLTQLKNNNYSRERFADRFVQMVHNKSQDMINAYLRG
ncbi:MAG: caspase family protein, partial [Ferruginibacter sp.]